MFSFFSGKCCRSYVCTLLLKFSAEGLPSVDQVHALWILKVCVFVVGRWVCVRCMWGIYALLFHKVGSFSCLHYIAGYKDSLRLHGLIIHSSQLS